MAFVFQKPIPSVDRQRPSEIKSLPGSSSSGCNSTNVEVGRPTVAQPKSSVTLSVATGIIKTSKIPSPIQSSTKSAVPSKPTEMYDADIDYMNTYLKSLPDYTELNKKISSEYRKCEAMYDQLQHLRRSNPLAKSNSLQCVSQYRQLMASMAQPQTVSTVTVTTAADCPTAISRSTSSTAIPDVRQNDAATGTNQPIQLKLQHRREPLAPVASPPNSGHSNIAAPASAVDALKKSASVTCLNNTKNVLNSFWTQNIAKANHQRSGWNYNRIMSAQSSATQTQSKKSPIAPPAPPVRMQSYEYRSKKPADDVSGAADVLPPKLPDKPRHMFPIQKNMSLSHLDQRSRQPPITKEQFYSLVCGESKATAQQRPNPPPLPEPLAKSISHTNLAYSALPHPTPSLVPTVQPKSLLSKSVSKSNIPSIFRLPLCKSASNTHVFRVPASDMDATAAFPATETFTPHTRDRLLLLAKSSSSSCVPSVPMRRHEPSAAQQRIVHNHELLQKIGAGTSAVNPFVAEANEPSLPPQPKVPGRAPLMKMPSFVERFTSHAKIYPARPAPPTPTPTPTSTSQQTSTVPPPPPPAQSHQLQSANPAPHANSTHAPPPNHNHNQFTPNSIMRSASGNLHHHFAIGQPHSQRPAMRAQLDARQRAQQQPLAPPPSSVDPFAPRLTNSASFGSLNFYAHKAPPSLASPAAKAAPGSCQFYMPASFRGQPAQHAPLRPQQQPQPMLPQRLNSNHPLRNSALQQLQQQQLLQHGQLVVSATATATATSTTQSWRRTIEQQRMQRQQPQQPTLPIHYHTQCVTVTSSGEVDTCFAHRISAVQVHFCIELTCQARLMCCV